MRKVVKLISMFCVLSTLIIGCQNINQQSEDTSVISLEMPKALFQSVSTNAKVTEYTIIGTISNADSEAKIETVTQTRNSDEDSTTLSFSPITVQTPIILSIEIYAEKQLYMSGSSARHAVTEGKQALDITLTKADGYVEKGSGIITGVAKYTNSSDQSNITIFIQKEDEVISTDTASSSFVPVQSIARYASTSASASTFTVVSVCSAVKADKDGNYSFTNLDAGTYSIYAASQNSTKASYDTVAVTDGTTSTVNLDLTATGSISGTVLLDGNTTGNSGIFVYVKGTSFIATTNDDGTFTISNVPVSTTAYTLHAKYGTTDKTFTVNETAAAPVVTSGATADAGTMTFTTLEDKHYLSSSTTATDGTVTTTATANYVQATSAGLKFVLTEIPDNTTVVQFYVTNSDGHTTTYSIDTMDSSNNYESTEITDDLVFIFKLVNKGDTYTSAKTYFYKKGWTNSSLVSTTESIISIGGLGEITVSSKSITYDQTSNTVTIDKPVYNYDNFNGTVYSKYSDFNVVTSAGVSKSLSIPSSNSINLFTDFGSSSIEAISGQTGSTFKTIYSVRLPEDNVIATNNWSYNYGIYANKLAAQDINTFTPILTAYANGGQVRSITTDAAGKVTVNQILGESYVNPDTSSSVTIATTYADLYKYIGGTLCQSYDFYYGTDIQPQIHLKDNDGNYKRLGDIANSTDAIGYKSFTLYPNWTLCPTTTSWTGSFQFVPSTNTISLSSSLLTKSGVLTITTTETAPRFDMSLTDCTISNYLANGTSQIYTIATSGTTPSITISNGVSCTVTGISFQ